jgi:FkbM family methyltransferase
MAKNIRVTTEGALQVIRDLGWRPGSVIDIGVAMGTKGLYPIWPDAHICLIEPSPTGLVYMQQIAEKYPNVHIYNVGASNRNGKFRASTHSKLVNVIMAKPKPGWTETALPVLTCDYIVKDAGLPPPYLFKLDTDSHEAEVLEGAAETLKQTDLCIVEVNVFNRFRHRFTPGEMWDAMRRNGFTLLDIAGCGYNTQGLLRTADLMFVREDSDLFRLAFERSAKGDQLKERRIRQQHDSVVENKFI